MPDIIIKPEVVVEDEADEVDEILQELQSQKSLSETRTNEINERLGLCLTKLEALSVGSNAENPILIQLSNQIAEIKVDVSTALNSLEDMKARNLERSEFPVVIEQVPENPDLPSLEESTEDPSVENVPPAPVRKNRML